MRPRLVLFAVAALIIALAGCSDDDSGDGASTDDGSDDAGTVSTVVGVEGDSDLGDFPVPLPPGADAALETDAGPDVRIAQFIIPLDRIDEAIEFYDGWTGSGSGEWQRTESAEGGISWQKTSDADDGVIIAILTQLGDDDFRAATITVGPIT